MRVYVFGKGCQATEIGTGEAASKFAAWLAEDANPALTEIIRTWLWLPAESGGLSALAESAWDVAALRAEVLAGWQAATEHAEGQATG